MPANKQLLVVEDIAETRDWLVAAGGRVWPDREIAAVGDLAAARRWLRIGRRSDAPLIALVDIGLPDGSGLDLLADLGVDALAVSIVTTIFDDDAHLLAAMGAGAAGYLLKDSDADELERRLAGVEKGEVAISPAMARRMLAHFRTRAAAIPLPEGAPLTPRETDVLRLIGRGLRIAEAAGTLGISEQTVASYVKTIYRKLDITSRAEAALEASRRGLT